MTTRTPTDPFSPAGTLSRDQLVRYALGKLAPAEQQEVELHLERDPLLREALEGMRIPGSLAAMEELSKAPKASGGGGATIWVIGGAVLFTLAGVRYATRKDGPNVSDPSEQNAAVLAPPVSPEGRAAFAREVQQAKGLPKEQRSGNGLEETFIGARLDKGDHKRVEEGLPRMETRATPVERDQSGDGPRTLDTPSASRKLLYLHDLKLIDPSELYPSDPALSVRMGSVDAQFTDAAAQAAAVPEGTPIPYERFMDDAMAKFVAGDRQGCLQQLFFLMDQYPDDLNALFYAGLCSYELGLHQRAMGYLARAKNHRIDTFMEEAEWYHALAVEKVQGVEAAKPLIEKVVGRNKFYAARADAWLSEHL
jgi:tetratricopeptide (TPR) repeat protein